MPTLSSTRRGAFAALSGLGLSAAAPLHPARQAAPGEWTLPFSAVVPLDSAINGVAYDLYVRVPPTYDAANGPYPLILTLDADYAFAICANHLEHLADRMNQAPQAVLVSVAYRGVYPDKDRYRAERTRDYTPIFFPTGGYGPTFQANSGGGPDFVKVLEDEVLPLIAARWSVSTDDRTLVGHSYGGLFTAWMLQTRPDLFSRYLMVSPSLWYAGQMILKAEDALASTRLDRLTRAYLAVGSWEEQPENGGYMVSELERFAAQLVARADPNLIVKSRVFEDETHASIFPAAFSTGIRHLFNTMDGD